MNKDKNNTSKTLNTLDLIDIGANLTHESFQKDLDEVLTNASNAGVNTLIVTGASKQGSLAAKSLAERYPQLYATAGIHPHDASQFDQDTANLLRELGQAKEVVAMGECGLDFHRDFSPRAIQETCFATQLEISREMGKPVFLHERDAHDRFVTILSPFLNDLPKVVVHCFTGTASQLQTYIELGCYIGITGWICDERRGYHLKECISNIPADRLMIETDAPYLMPRDMRPKPKTRRNEPRYLPHILNTVAEAVGKPVEQVAAETTATARAFFGLNS